MKKLFYYSMIIFAGCSSSNNETADQYEEQASRVKIIRDQWGIAHVYGKTDADAVFGMMYGQCEESFDRVERNYLRVLGRMSEVEDERYFYQDLAMKILYDTATAIKDYNNSPAWLKKLLHAFADGINSYLYKHPGTKP